MLLSPATAVPSALDAGLLPEHFYRPIHGHIAAAIFALADAGTDIDTLTVHDRLAADGLADRSTGSDLMSMMAEVPATGHARRYAEIVARLGYLRQWIGIANEMAELGYAVPGDLDEIGPFVERAEYLLAQLNGRRQSSLVIRSFDEIELESVEWIWEGRIPRRMVTIVAGDPGVGKSYVLTALAADLSVGAMPAATNHVAPTSSLIVNYEDAAGVTLKRRIMACGADQRRIHFLDGVADGVGIRPFRPDDARQLEVELARRPDVGLVVIDPVGSLLAGKLDMARDNEVRGALLPLVDMARRTNTAVVAVMHLRKEDAERVIYRVGGSVGGFVGLARSVLVVAKHRDSGRRAVAHPKCNVGPEMPSVEYVIGPDGCFRWKGVADDLSAETMLSAGGHSKRMAAAGWLTERLADGPVLRDTIVGEGAKQGYSYATLIRALEEIGGDSVQPPRLGKIGRGPAYWFLEEPPSGP